MDWRDRIVSDKNILLGKPVIKGTRLSVEFMMGLFAGGWTEQQVLENYPGIAKEDLQAVFAYAQECFEDGLMYEPHRKAK